VLVSEYQAPLADIDFVLDSIVDLTSISKLNGYQHADPDTVSGVLAEAGRFFAEVIAPTNRMGDLHGSRLVDGGVVTPDGFKDAYAKYVESGWAGVHSPEDWGGGGMPYSVGIAVQEMFKSANMALSLCPLLTQAAIDALIEHGSDEQRALYLEKLITGEWTGTMCLTEAQAGSDVGALTTRATRQDDGSYLITGQKIFITWGDQDLTENIIHLILARTPDAAPGTKGISLFIVPKFLLDDQGRPGARNNIEIVSLEHKLGIHGSPTCVVSFGTDEGGAVGYLVGEEQRGMKYMFTMMNVARVGVGIEGLALAERAYQKAAAFAAERIQGRTVGADAGVASPIIAHPDVRRMLLTMRSYIEAMRALLYVTAAYADRERHGETEADRVNAGELTALLTPIAKAWCTDLGVEMTSIGLQVHGGMGYVEETGAAQFYRDARIAPIYEGTNGIQAMDLTMRKLPMRDGAVVAGLIGEMQSVADELVGVEGFGKAAHEFGDAIQTLAETSAWLGSRLAAGAYNDALAGATPYLKLFGTVVGGWLMAREALAARGMLDSGRGDPSFARAKLTTTRFYLEQLVPTASGGAAAVTAGSDVLYEADLTVR
jgi:alkylation response protein AidB-like acyl-CoA dehydrogenase